MIKKILFLIIFVTIQVCAQEVKIPELVLSGISFDLELQNGKQSDLVVLTESGDTVTTVLVDGKTPLTINESGIYSIVKPSGDVVGSIRVIPGILSIIPPLLAILLAFVFRQVLISLAAGIYVGALFIYNYDPFTAFLRFSDTFIVKSTIDESHLYITLFTLMIGGLVGIISKNGGTEALARIITKFAKTPKSGMLSSWGLGLLIFFDDYSNTLIIGNMMRPITDKLKISREKLAYIVDSTSAPIASLVIISTWIGFELGLIQDGLTAIGSDKSAYYLFMESILYRFYPFASLFMVFFIAFMDRDFGPMQKAETLARKKEIVKEKAEISENSTKWWNGLVPILILIFGVIAALFYTGITSLNEAGVKTYGLKEIISNGDSFRSLLWASTFGVIVAIVMTRIQKLLTLDETMEAWQKGVQSMLYASIILVFAWAISMITTELKTADYVISAVGDLFNVRFLPAVVFIVCSIISFATGTSWGTMAIVMPIVIPLVHEMAGGLTPEVYGGLLTGVVSSVLAGAVWGDHCSPIADTTILSSMSAGSNHIAHVRTQLPYALTAGIIGILFGEIPAAFGVHPLLSIIMIAFTVMIIVRFIGKKNEIIV